MENIINFEFDTKLDNKIFLDYVWDKLYYIAYIKKEKHIIIDFNNISLIKIEVLPKLCSMGLMAKKDDVQIELNINPYSKVKEYLGEIGFFDIVKKYNIFKLNEDQIGGYNNSSKVTKSFICFDRNEILKKYESKYIFSEKVSLANKLKYCIEAEIFGEKYLFSPGIVTDKMISDSAILWALSNICDNPYTKMDILNELGLDFTELIHNSLWHGNTLCFFAIQAGTYKYSKGLFKKVNICISDTGDGLYSTFVKKDWNKINRTPHFITANVNMSEDKKNYYSILEMIYFRSKDINRGVYDIMKNLKKKNKLEINILNKNIGISFNKNGLENILAENYNENVSKYKKKKINYGFSIDISFEP